MIRGEGIPYLEALEKLKSAIPVRSIGDPKDYGVLAAVKAGTTEGYIHDLLGTKTEIFFTLFTEEEIINYFTQAGFILKFIEKRNPYDFEISNERIFAIGEKV